MAVGTVPDWEQVKVAERVPDWEEGMELPCRQ